MWFFSLCLTLVFAASFTSQNNNVNEFVKYRGNREHLETLINIFGTVSDDFDRNALSLDDLISDQLILSLFKSLGSMEAKYEKLGVLLSDLSPARFDGLCTALEIFDLDPTQLVRGYQNGSSKWKIMSSMCPDAKSIPQALAAHVSVEYCDYLATNPAQILTKSSLKPCIDYWMELGRLADVRRVLQQRPWFYSFHSTAANRAFIGNESEYVRLVCDIVSHCDGVYWLRWIHLPDFIRVSQILPLIKLALSKEWPYGIQIRSDNQDREMQALIAELNRDIHERDPIFNAIDFDSEYFEGKWAMPKALEKWSRNLPQIWNLNFNYPEPLNQAFETAWTYGNASILSNTLNVMSALLVDAEQHIQRQYFA